MVSLAPTLNKMNRIVRDMCKKLNKDVDLELIGQDTEVDKNKVVNCRFIFGISFFSIVYKIS